MSFNELLDLYEKKVFRLMMGLVDSYQDAEELTQDVFVKVYRHMNQFKNQSQWSTWLYKIVINTARNFHLKKKAWQWITLDYFDLPDPTLSAEEKMVIKSDSDRMKRAFSLLPHKHRQVLLLRELEGLPFEEISVVLGCPLGTVKSRWFRARDDLKNTYQILEKGEVQHETRPIAAIIS